MPKMRTQLVAARTVAEALADLVTEPRSVRARIDLWRTGALLPGLDARLAIPIYD